MPFTLLHPVAVLPLAHGPMSLLALVSGALAPDLPYYLRAAPLPVSAESWYEPYVNATTSHSLTALLTVALPMALAIYLCGRVVCPPARWVAGVTPRPAPSPGVLETLGRGAWVVVSLLVGVLTHLAWDALTELGGPASRLLQHASTALGLVILGMWAWRRRHVLDLHEPIVRRRLAATAGACTLAAFAGAALAVRSELGTASGLATAEVVEAVVVDAVTGAVVGVAAMTAALCLVWWARRPGRGARC